MDRTEPPERRDRSRTRNRVLLAMILAPPAGGAAAAAAVVLIGLVFSVLSTGSLSSPGSNVIFYIQIVVAGVVIGATYGYPAIVIMGLPLYLLVQRLRIRSLLVWVILGILVASVTGLIVAFWSDRERLADIVKTPADMVRWLVGSFDIFVAVVALGGAVAGLVFWLIVRPDRSSDFRPLPRLETGEQHRA